MRCCCVWLLSSLFCPCAGLTPVLRHRVDHGVLRPVLVATRPAQRLVLMDGAQAAKNNVQFLDQVRIRQAVRSSAATIASLGSFLIADRWLKRATAAAGLSFPAPLIGMAAIFTVLSALSASGNERLADSIVGAAKPALDWLARWLPLFYVPPLVVLPLACRAAAAADLTKVGLIVGLGMPVSLLFTAKLAVAIRSLAQTELLPVAPVPPMPPYNRGHVLACAAAAVSGLAGAVALPAGTAAARLCGAIFGLSATAGGLLLGSMPSAAKPYLPHPVMVTALCASLSCALLGAATGTGYFASLGAYLAKGSGAPGAGDLLMGFLGSVVLSFGFRIYGQRALLRRHAAEVLGCAGGSALASMLVTCAAGRLLALPPPLTLAVAPRSVTVALALPIAAQLGAPAELMPVCAASVVLTGLLGAALAQKLLDAAGHKDDPITRGLSTAGSAHGLGTAALAAGEPESLPFCALAYGLIGVAANAWCAVPAVRGLLRSIAGATP